MKKVLAKRSKGIVMGRLKLAVLILGGIGVLFACTTDPVSEAEANAPAGPANNVVIDPAGNFDRAVISDLDTTSSDSEVRPFETAEAGTGDYSRFQHNNSFHSRLPCLLCHTRENNSARLSFPGKNGHLPCAGCHAVQFADQSSPMCTICHTNPQSGAMKRFPGLRTFRGKFDHSKHRRQDCTTCHAPQGRGVARSIPTGANAHDTCFKCHSSNSSPSMSSCSVCHEQGRRVWTSETARSFRMGFSHAAHTARQHLNCTSCHNLVRSGSRPGDQMSSPRPVMHFATSGSLSCGGCHNSKRAFGADDFANCKRCHNPQTFRF
jgi:c(7)-type cytochrome triheme protein